MCKATKWIGAKLQTDSRTDRQVDWIARCVQEINSYAWLLAHFENVLPVEQHVILNKLCLTLIWPCKKAVNSMHHIVNRMRYVCPRCRDITRRLIRWHLRGAVVTSDDVFEVPSRQMTSSKLHLAKWRHWASVLLNDVFEVPLRQMLSRYRLNWWRWTVRFIEYSKP